MATSQGKGSTEFRADESEPPVVARGSEEDHVLLIRTDEGEQVAVEMPDRVYDELKREIGFHDKS